jgi:hypothetical protein
MIKCPGLGWWTSEEISEIAGSERHKTLAPVKDAKAEERAKLAQIHPCITYYADVDLLQQGIIRKIEDGEGENVEKEGEADGREADVCQDDN